MTTGEIISLCALGVSLIALLIKSRRDNRGDVAGSAARDARLDAKLDNIDNGVSEVRVEMRAMRERQTEMGEKLAVLESSCKSAHHRIDTLTRQRGE